LKVTNIARKLVGSLKPELVPGNLKVFVINEDIANAFILPGKGRIYIE
jgi:predicted Zn-dependent protease